ncbi:MAG: type 1 glutamine amidotransferase [Nitrospirae bacterium]|nr:type 1 glutamine amidotransferase [Nitrospirota bacterium]
MPVLICKNIQSEGPGTIEDYLKSQKIPYKILELSKGERISDAESFDALIMMGGPMSVNDGIPYVTEEEKLVRDFVTKGKKVLGVCLGAQIMAKALGERVYAGPQKEIGWYDIELTEDGLKDNGMKRLALNSVDGGMSRKFKVFHWHGETFDIPKGGIRLASSELYPNQAFKYGDNAYAFQFHIEVSKEMVYSWLRNEPVDFGRLQDETEKLYVIYNSRAVNFYKSFLGES